MSLCLAVPSLAVSKENKRIYTDMILVIACGEGGKRSQLNIQIRDFMKDWTLNRKGEQ